MAQPYDLPEPRGDDAPMLTILTVIGIVFVAFMGYQISSTIAKGPEIVPVEDVRIQSTAEEGDTVEVHYTARTITGELYETTRYEVAQAAEGDGFLVGPPTSYGPVQVIVGDPGGPFDGRIADAILGLRTGHSATFQVPASEVASGWRTITPGEPGLDRVVFATPYQEYRFFQESAAAAAEGNPGTPGFDLDALEQQVENLEDGAVYEGQSVLPPALPIVFEDVNHDNRSVLVHYPVEPGTQRDVPGMPGHLTLVMENDTIAWRFDVPEGGTFVVQPGDAFHRVGLQPGSYMFGNVTETHVEFLHSDAPRPAVVGKDLIVEVRVVEVVQKAAERGTGLFDEPTPEGPAPNGTGADDGHEGHDH